MAFISGDVSDWFPTSWWLFGTLTQARQDTATHPFDVARLRAGSIADRTDAKYFLSRFEWPYAGLRDLESVIQSFCC